jgi:uncharacterized protein (TIGR03435 family)
MRSAMTVRRTALIGAVGVVLGAMSELQLAGQSHPPDTKPPAFEVASVKSHKDGDSTARFEITPGGRVVIQNLPLNEIVRVAYQLQNHQLVGGPDMVWSRFDIIAKADGDLPPLPPPPSFHAPSHPVLPMLRTLLAERFHLRVHHESRTLPMFALVLERSNGVLGPKLKQSNVKDCADIIAARRAARATNPVPPTGAAAPVSCGMRGTIGHTEADSQSMSQLVQLLAGAVHRVVEDRTNLDGLFNFTLDFAPDSPGLDVGNDAKPGGDASPSIFTAVREQLGLRLEAIRQATDVVVIDHVEQPTPD